MLDIDVAWLNSKLTEPRTVSFDVNTLEGGCWLTSRRILIIHGRPHQAWIQEVHCSIIGRIGSFNVNHCMLILSAVYVLNLVAVGIQSTPMRPK